ncbi:MAG: hypothetical protein RL660_3162 [Bacteroidota bacterium]|jgi:hypothetical protein
MAVFTKENASLQMQKIVLAFLLCVAVVKHAAAQSQPWQTSGEELHFLNRQELLNGKFASSFHAGHKQLGALDVLQHLEDSTTTTSRSDKFVRASILSQLQDWGGSSKDAKRVFYKDAHMYSKIGDNYAVVIDPMINYQHAYEPNNTSGTKFINTRGFEIRANVKQRLYMYTQLTENQERGPSYFQNFIYGMEQVPGATYIKYFNNRPGMSGGFDYSVAKGHIGYSVLPKHLDFTFGHDRYFIGNGYRSLFLSDFGANALNAKMDLRFWKLHYQTIFFELMPTVDFVSDFNRPRKYAAMHHVAFHFKPWLQVGVFEAATHKRVNHFEFQYLNPLIFYRTIEQSLGSPDNALLGLDVRALPFKRTELYGQFLLDEFKFDAMTSTLKDWRNKYAFQLGAKHANLAGIDNLDVQLEYNYIRPFTYSYADSVANYTHYNQALAHPNGANLTEWIGVVRYQPLPRLLIRADVIRRMQGFDTSTVYSNGGNIFKSYNARPSDVGFMMGNGIKKVNLYANLNLSYQVYHMAYIDAGFTLNNSTVTASGVATKSNFVYIGARLNAPRRLYNY